MLRKMPLPDGQQTRNKKRGKANGSPSMGSNAAYGAKSIGM